jgi:hypothetical protein
MGWTGFGWLKHGNEPWGFRKKAWYCLTSWVTMSFSNNILHHGVSNFIKYPLKPTTAVMDQWGWPWQHFLSVRNSSRKFGTKQRKFHPPSSRVNFPNNSRSPCFYSEHHLRQCNVPWNCCRPVTVNTFKHLLMDFLCNNSELWAKQIEPCNDSGRFSQWSEWQRSGGLGFSSRENMDFILSHYIQTGSETTQPHTQWAPWVLALR